jgi:diguanylate cyclase (GGDEF)-like protein
MYFIDLDGFKCVNDTLGHAEGDAVLARVGSKLRAITRAEDVVIRWGGDEFVALCSHKPRPESTASDLDPAPFIGYRMVEELSFSHRHGDLGDFPISASIGAVKLETEALCFLAHPDDRIVRGVLDSLIKSADKAMYCAKQSGKSQLVLAR